MPAINFRAEFAALVESGKKRQTIRDFREDGRNPRPGQTLYLYVGMRTKGCRKLGEGTCSTVHQVRVEWHGVCLDGGWLGFDEQDTFAIADGFDSFPVMRDWFERQHGLPFDGLCIRWGALR